VGSADRFAQGRTCFNFAQLFLNPVEVAELAKDPRDQSGFLVPGFEKLPPDVGVAAHEG